MLKKGEVRQGAHPAQYEKGHQSDLLREGFYVHYREYYKKGLFPLELTLILKRTEIKRERIIVYETRTRLSNFK